MNAVVSENQESELAWEAVCKSEDVPPMLGARALINGEQVALFRVKGEVYAVSAIDPFTNAAVLARGIVGDLQGHLVVASPIYKQHFDLKTGECLEDESVTLKVYPAKEIDGLIYIGTGK